MVHILNMSLYYSTFTDWKISLIKIGLKYFDHYILYRNSIDYEALNTCADNVSDILQVVFSGD